MYKKILLIIFAFTVDHAMACKNIELNNLKCTENYGGEIVDYTINKAVFTENNFTLTFEDETFSETLPSDITDEDGWRNQLNCINSNLHVTDSFLGVSATRTVIISNKGLSLTGKTLGEIICDENGCTHPEKVDYNGSCTL